MAEKDKNDQIKRLYGNLHLVPFTMIDLAERRNESESGSYHFSNPRHLTEFGENQTLHNKESHQLMIDSIRDMGLLNPIAVRIINGRAQLIAGESRYRAIAWLTNKKEKVKDPNSGKLNESTGCCEYSYHPANEVYGMVPCQIFDGSTDLEALAISYAENRIRQQLSDGHDVALLRELRADEDIEDSKICTILCKEPQWVRETDKLISGLDSETLTAFCENRINREAAKKLLKECETDEHRQAVLKKTISISEQVAKEQAEKLDEYIEAALEQEEIFDGEAAAQEHLGDEPAAAEAREKAEKAKKKAKKGKADKNKVKATGKSKHVDQATHDLTGSAPPKCLRGPKIVKHYQEPLLELLVEDNIRGNVVKGHDNSYNLSVQAVELAVRIVEGIVNGDTDVHSMLKETYKKKKKEEEED